MPPFREVFPERNGGREFLSYLLDVPKSVIYPILYLGVSLKACIFVEAICSVPNSIMQKKPSILELEQVMNTYLLACDLKPTRGRSKILSTIYTMDRPFDADTVFEKMKQVGYAVSRSTVYTTLDLLSRCGVLIRLARSNASVYLFAWRCVGYSLVFCTECGKVNYYRQTSLIRRLQLLQPPRFKKRQSVVLTLGNCSDCAKGLKGGTGKKNE